MPMRRRVTLRELVDLVRAQVALVRALVRVRLTPVGDLVVAQHEQQAEPAGGGSGSHPRPALGTDRSHAAEVGRGLTLAERRALAQRMELALGRAARRGFFRPTCLVHSLALAELLGRGGADGAVIRLGVRPGGGNQVGASIEAHAWVELDGLMLDGSAAHSRRFTSLGAVQAAPPPRR